MKAPNLDFRIQANDKTEAVCMALGWMYQEVCTQLDNGKDPRQTEPSHYIEKGILELSQGNKCPQ